MRTQGISLEMLEWKHWQTGHDYDFHLDDEVLRVKELVKSEQFRIVAKSVGTLVSAAFILETSRVPDKLVWLGVPLADLTPAEQDYYLQLLHNYPDLPIGILQNATDPHGSFKMVKDFMTQVRPEIEITETDRSDHHYPFYEQIHQLLIG